MWTVEFVNETAADELDVLPEDMQAYFKRIVGLIKIRGIAQVHNRTSSISKGRCGKCG